MKSKTGTMWFIIFLLLAIVVLQGRSILYINKTIDIQQATIGVLIENQKNINERLNIVNDKYDELYRNSNSNSY